MINKGFAFLLFSLILNSFRSAFAISLIIPTTSGQITTNLTPFERSGSTAEDVYNYMNARYNGDISIDFGTNLFIVNTLEGASLFVVNQVEAGFPGQLQYQLTAEGTLSFRDDQPGVDNDPVIEIPNADSTTTFISREGFLGSSCINGACPTDGLVISLTNENAAIDWQYNLGSSALPLMNIEQINFLSANSSENESLELFTEFDTDGQVVINAVVPESSSHWGLFVGGIAALLVKKFN